MARRSCAVTRVVLLFWLGLAVCAGCARDEDEEAFRAAATADTQESYRTYTTRFPAGKHAQEALERGRRAHQRTVASALRAAQQAGTTAAFVEFLGEYPDEPTAATARQALERMWAYPGVPAQWGEAREFHQVTRDGILKVKKYYSGKFLGPWMTHTRQRVGGPVRIDGFGAISATSKVGLAIRDERGRTVVHVVFDTIIDMPGEGAAEKYGGPDRR